MNNEYEQKASLLEDPSELRNFVKDRHGDQKRSQGTPYYEHPFAVADKLAEKGYGVGYQVAALCHDLLEDTDTTYEELAGRVGADVANVVRLLTKEEGYQMADYIKRIESNEMAKAVKLADKLHNLSELHLASKNFRERQIAETKQWYVEMAKGTPFEWEIMHLLEKLENDKDE